ncbi:hypothetical protein LCGC14_0204560 [marine sediment metagenome]|uniref:Homeodomain phBC6A51-type domain-containing protein n=1 Tax=marine sediment metagenome TaxID=412755 RepID=A0A0F9XKT6_9ZZZZ|nr:hypothetical protein [Phycisphaerae bacterium]
MTNGTDFEPSEDQKKLLEVVQDSGYGMSVTAACATAGVARRTYYNWFDAPDFVAWWKDRYERHLAMQLPRIYHAMMESALGHNKDANPQAIKLTLERFDKGYTPRSKQQIQGAVEVTFEERLRKLQIAAAEEEARAEELDGIGDRGLRREQGV